MPSHVIDIWRSIDALLDYIKEKGLDQATGKEIRGELENCLGILKLSFGDLHHPRSWSNVLNALEHFKKAYHLAGGVKDEAVYKWFDKIDTRRETLEREIATAINTSLKSQPQEPLRASEPEGQSQPVVDKTKSKNPIKKPSMPQTKAWKSYQWAINNKPDLLLKLENKNEESRINPRWYSREIYEHIKENAPYYENHPTNKTPMPSYNTWVRYISHYSKCLDSIRTDISPDDNDQPLTAVRRQGIQDGDLKNISSRFEND